MSRYKAKSQPSIFSQRLAELLEGDRKRPQTAQQKLADYLGVKRQTISEYKNDTSQPNSEKLGKIAEFFNVSSDYLLGLADSYEKDMADRIIEEKTGLPLSTIESFKRMKEGSDGKNNMIVFNELVDMQFLESIVDNFRDCIQLKYLTDVAEKGMEVFGVEESSENENDKPNDKTEEKIKKKRARQIDTYVEWTFVNNMTKIYGKVLKHFTNPKEFKNGKSLFEDMVDEIDSDLQEPYRAMMDNGETAILHRISEILTDKGDKDEALFLLKFILDSKKASENNSQPKP